MIAILAFVLSAVIIPIGLLLLVEWAPLLAHRIVRAAAARLGEAAASERYVAEWEGEMAELPGGLSQLCFALGRILYLPAMTREIRRSWLQPGDLEGRDGKFKWEMLMPVGTPSIGDE
ncbi:hypothetical protein [Glycomyces albidus]|uniref:Uncharacterized protein n=1 Tax=Glycomyces albidus TaxID=2656774 RepID=A0A6L5G905_9ACTN|nr:hypothetical protein [Glycomyces albidus]MQM26144.1 hypothetical protein [Glycomyces albidus]